MFHALSTVLRQEGPRALYKGWLPSVIGVVSTHNLFFHWHGGSFRVPFMYIDLHFFSMLLTFYSLFTKENPVIVWMFGVCFIALIFTWLWFLTWFLMAFLLLNTCTLESVSHLNLIKCSMGRFYLGLLMLTPHCTNIIVFVMRLKNALFYRMWFNHLCICKLIIGS